MVPKRRSFAPRTTLHPRRDARTHAADNHIRGQSYTSPGLSLLMLHVVVHLFRMAEQAGAEASIVRTRPGISGYVAQVLLRAKPFSSAESSASGGLKCGLRVAVAGYVAGSDQPLWFRKSMLKHHAGGRPRGLLGRFRKGAPLNWGPCQARDPQQLFTIGGSFRGRGNPILTAPSGDVSVAGEPRF